MTRTRDKFSALALARTALIALAITLMPQGIWSALIVANLRTTPKIPWAVGVVAAALWLVVRYRRAWNRSASDATGRHEAPRATLVSRPVLLWAWMAGACALVALVGCWIVLASFVRMPGSVLPAFAGYPWWTVVLAVGTGAAISPLCEQIGLWGYWQVALERQYSAPAAIVVTAIAFAVLPHPPVPAPLWPKWVFFFLTGLMFSTMAYLSDSILPGLALHMVSLLIFFVLVWPFDPQRPLIGEVGSNGWLWLHIAQVVAFSIAAAWAFRRLSATNDRQRASVLRSPPASLAWLVAATLLLGGPTLAAQSADPLVATWTVHIAKSNYDPGPAPRSLTMTVTADERGYTITQDQVAADGKTSHAVILMKPDGRECPVDAAMPTTVASTP